MAIMARDSGGGDFTPHPQGMHQMVCIDVIDKGMRDTPWGEKHKIVIRWQSAEVGSKGYRLTVQKMYTLSLHEKSGLRADLQSWRGRPFTIAEARGFDVESLLGVNALVNVIHKPSPDGSKTWANVVGINPLMKGMEKLTPAEDYIRECDREDDENQPEPHEVPHDDGAPLTDDDIPF